jgi:hypothetical protein
MPSLAVPASSSPMTVTSKFSLMAAGFLASIVQVITFPAILPSLMTSEPIGLSIRPVSVFPSRTS